MTIAVNYEKRKNQELFRDLEKIGFLKTQNYIPLYRNFFILNENNYSAVNLNHFHYIDGIKKPFTDNLYLCNIKSKIAKPSQERVFFKFAPLLDPVKYMIGKYTYDDKLMTLPTIHSTTEHTTAKFLDPNNCSYVDGFFSYLSNQLMSSNKFVHGIRYYGSYLTVKKDFKFNVYDDLEYLIKSDFFNKNKNKLFHVDNYSDLFDDDTSRAELPAIKIHQEDVGDALNIGSVDESMFGDVFMEEADTTGLVEDNILPLTLENVEEHDVSKEGDVETTSVTKSNDSCSSRTSHTNSGVSDDDDENSVVSYTDDENESDGDESSDSSEDEEEIVNATFPEFPVQLICMEACIDTLDQLILDDKLDEKRWLSALMQIIMTLIAYQKVFSFTHNDLHTNNVMYVSTKKKYLYYCVKGTYYRVPTYGKIFKIIDFGRAIYKYDGKTMCSDSFGPTGDAATQYYIEPYYNPKKPRLDPNYSFDLCRLA